MKLFNIDEQQLLERLYQMPHGEPFRIDEFLLHSIEIETVPGIPRQYLLSALSCYFRRVHEEHIFKAWTPIWYRGAARGRKHSFVMFYPDSMDSNFYIMRPADSSPATYRNRDWRQAFGTHGFPAWRQLCELLPLNTASSINSIARRIPELDHYAEHNRPFVLKQILRNIVRLAKERPTSYSGPFPLTLDTRRDLIIIHNHEFFP